MKRENSHDLVIEGVNAVMAQSGLPTISYISKTFEFPDGTTIIEVQVIPSTIHNLHLEQELTGMTERYLCCEDNRFLLK